MGTCNTRHLFFVWGALEWMGAVLIGFGLILASGVAEEEAQAETLTLNLQQLIDRAIAKSPEVGQVRSEIASAQSDLDQVKGGYYPQIETIGLAGPVKDADLPVVRGGRITDPSPELSLSTIGVFGNFSFAITQPVHTFGKLSNRKEAASRGVKVREHRLDERKNDIALRVKQLYYALILARSGIEVSDEADAFFEDARKRIQRLLELGSSNAVESDLYRVDAYRSQTLRSRAEAEKGAKVAYFALKAMIQLPPKVEFEVDRKSLPRKEEAMKTLESYIERSLSDRPELKQLDEALAAQASLVRAAESDRYPSVFVLVGGSLAGAPGRDKLDNPYIPDEFNHAYAGFVAGVKWNFDFGISKAKVGKEKAEYDKLLNTLATGKLNIPIQVAKSYQEISEWKASVEAYNRAAVASRKWVVSAMTSFDMGVGTADDMMKAIEKYGENQSKYVEALFNYHLAVAELEYAVGEKG